MKVQQIEYRVDWLMYPTGMDATKHTHSFTTKKAATKFFNMMKQQRDGVTLYKVTAEPLGKIHD